MWTAADFAPAIAASESGGTVGAADAAKPGDNIVASATTRTAVLLTRWNPPSSVVSSTTGARQSDE